MQSEDGGGGGAHTGSPRRARWYASHVWTVLIVLLVPFGWLYPLVVAALRIVFRPAPPVAVAARVSPTPVAGSGQRR